MLWLSKIRLSSRETPRRPGVVAFDLPPGLRKPVVLALANPTRAAGLVAVAARIAAARRTGVVILHVAPALHPGQPVPPSSPGLWPALDAGLVALRAAGVLAGWLVRSAEDVGQAIRETAVELNASLIVLGWQGAQPHQSASLATVLEDPLCDVVVVGGHASGLPQHILLSVGTGPHAELAAHLAAELASKAETTSVTAIHVVTPGQMPRRVFAAAERQFRQTLGRDFLAAHVTRKTVVSEGTAQAILDELAVGYDAVLMGTSREALIDRLSFGDVPQRVAEESQTTVIVARRHMSMATRVLRDLWQAITDALPVLAAGERDDVRTAIRQGARSQADFYVMIGLAAVLAGLGLLLNSPAVIIGAMLVAPLMSAIVGLGLGVVEGDTELLGAATWTTVRGMSVAIIIGVALGLMIPDASATPEVMARVRPSVLDLGVALASGAAGAYALCRKGVSAGLAGVAIAAALVPPLTTVGIGLALGRGDIASGALLLFITNLIAIAAAGGIVFLMLGFAPPASQKARRSVLRRGVAGAIALLLLVTLILGIVTVQALQSVRLERALRAAVQNQVAALLPDSELVEWKQSSRADGTLHLMVTVRSSQQHPYGTVLAFQREVATQMQRPVALLLNVIPATRLDPLVPPTLTPRPTPTPTSTPGPTLAVTPARSPSPTATAIATASPIATATATASPTATPSHTPTPTRTATATATPRPTPGFAVIDKTNGFGVLLHESPGGPIIAPLAEGAPLIVTGERAEAGGYVWLQVIASRGQIGWVAADYLTLVGPQPG